MNILIFLTNFTYIVSFIPLYFFYKYLVKNVFESLMSIYPEKIKTPLKQANETEVNQFTGEEV